MTTIRINEIADRHLDQWFSDDPLLSRKTLREYVADAITEALNEDAKEFRAGAATLRFERDKAINSVMRSPIREDNPSDLPL